MDLNDVLGDSPIPTRTEPTGSAPDGKPEPVEAKEPAAPSAAKETEPVKTEAEKPEVKAEADRGRDDKGRFVKSVPHEAFHAERVKRQELERKLQEIQNAKPKTSVLENEDQAFTERLSAATAPIMERFFKLSVKTARNTAGRDDYESVSQAFAQAAENDPQLWQSFRESDDPGEYIYTVGKQLKELAEFGGDIVKYGEKKRAEGQAEAEALKQQLKAMQAEIETLKASKDKQSKVPQSLNGEQSATTKGESFTGPRSLTNILNS